jgi:hypothetical protein
LVQAGVNVTGVPGATGAAAVAAGETPIVHTGGMPNADPQTRKRNATAKACAIGRPRTKEDDPDFTGKLERKGSEGEATLSIESASISIERLM